MQREPMAHIQAHLGDTVGLVPDHRDEASHNLSATGGSLLSVCKTHISEVQLSRGMPVVFLEFRI